MSYQSSINPHEAIRLNLLASLSPEALNVGLREQGEVGLKTCLWKYLGESPYGFKNRI